MPSAFLPGQELANLLEFVLREFPIQKEMIQELRTHPEERVRDISLMILASGKTM